MFRTACLLAWAAALGSAAAPPGERWCDGSSEVCGAEHADDTSMLQFNVRNHRLDAAAKARRVSTTTAVTFAGGGFLSLADFTGAFMGLLHVQQQRGEHGGLQRLFQKFGAVAGVSGGSWTTQLLIYSPTFEELVLKGSRFPEGAAALYNTDVITKLLLRWSDMAAAGGGVGGGLPACLASLTEDFADFGQLLQENLHEFEHNLDLLKKAGDLSENLWRKAEKGAADIVAHFKHLLLEATPQQPKSRQVAKMLDNLGVDYLIMVAGLLLTSGGVQWADYVAHLLAAVGDLDPGLPLGTGSVNAWARGKVNVLSASATTPPGPDDFEKPDPATEIAQEITIDEGAGSKLTSAGSQGSFNFVQPVRFSVVVGGDESQVAPLPFCSSSDCQSYQATYTTGDTAFGAEPLRAQFLNAFEQSAGRLPISSASACSSAFLGYTFLQNSIASQDCAAFSVWATNAGAGESFAAATGLRQRMFGTALTDQMAKQVASAGLQPLIDGAFTDGSGIATVIAGGATEVLSFQDNLYGSAPEYFTQLFQPSQTAPSEPGRVLFKQPTSEDVKARYMEYKRIWAPAGSTKLVAIAYETLTCVTAKNDFFGVEEDRQVKLNLFAIETKNITMGTPGQGFNGFYDYGTLVAEIVNTLIHAPETPGILEAFF